MLMKAIVVLGRQCTLACDARCDKAWGINLRPAIPLSDNPNDYAFFSDEELGTAPVDPGTREGSDAKPSNNGELLNKWCARECERSQLVARGETIRLTDFTKRVYNVPKLHQESS